MSTRSDIRELVKGGALSAAAIGEKTGAANVQTVLYQMVAAGQLKRKGKGEAALYGPGTGRKPAAKKKATRAGKVKAKKGGGGGRTVARKKPAPASDFMALVGNGGTLVILRGAERMVFTEEESAKIADAVHFAYAMTA